MRSALLLGALGMVTVLARLAAHLETDWLWFDELGQEQVFWTLLTTKWLAGSLAGIATTTVLLANFWLWRGRRRRRPGSRAAIPEPCDCDRLLLAGSLAISAAAGFFVGKSVVRVDWQQLALWAHRQEFGIVDPLFHKDVGFFVFSLPLYQKVSQWLFVTIAVALVAAVAGHVATGAIRTKPAPVSATRGAHAHVLVLAALLLLVVAWKHWLGQFALELSNSNRTVPGAGYTEVHVLLPWLRVLVLVTLAAAVALLVAAVRRSWTVPAIVLVIVAVAELVNPSVLPSVVQRVVVDPQTLSRERPYLAHSVKYTQLAWGLDDVARSRASRERRNLAGRTAVEPGRPSEHPALGYRRPDTADRPAAVHRLLLHVPKHHGGPVPPPRRREGDDPRPARA